jgi:hypothetical protein
MAIALYISLVINVLFTLWAVLLWIRDPHPPMPTERLLFLRRKLEKFRTLDYMEIWELFRAVAEYSRGK